MTPLHETAAWQDLAAAARTLNGTEASTLHLTAGAITADLTRHPVSNSIWQKLLTLAAQEQVLQQRDQLFQSAVVNHSEQRAAEHWALRLPVPAPPLAAVDARIAALVDQLQQGQLLGAAGQPITHIVNLGIGGSDLGPRLLADALAEFAAPHLRAHFIANIDPSEAARVLADVPPEKTLFIVVSKSFNTLETKENAAACRAWWLAKTGQAPAAATTALAKHFVAVTSNQAAATAFGIAPENCFAFPDTIGGRYSLWGPVGLAPRLLIGNENFAALRAGAHVIDTHFQTAPSAENLPIVLALLTLWHRNFLQAGAQAILPYAHGLQLLPAYLQQLIMESNGKGVTRTGAPVPYATAPVIFGAAGTVGQHSFYQQLHQGPEVIPSDIILVNHPHAQTLHQLPGAAAQHQWLLANGFAQAQALWQGRADPALPPHRQFRGRRAVTLLTLPHLTPATLGQLLALYEHRTFVESCLWRINAFDQWGVELGKTLAEQVFSTLSHS